MISATAGVALVVDGDRLASLHAAEPERWIPRRPEELHLLIGEGLDFVPVENVSREEIASTQETVYLASENAFPRGVTLPG